MFRHRGCLSAGPDIHPPLQTPKLAPMAENPVFRFHSEVLKICSHLCGVEMLRFFFYCRNDEIRLFPFHF